MRISDWSSDVCSSDLVGSAKRISVLVIGPCVRSIRPPPRAVWRGGTGLAAGSAAVAIGVGVSVKQDPPRLRGGGPPGGWWSGFASRRHVAQGRQPPPSAVPAATSPRAGRNFGRRSPQAGQRGRQAVGFGFLRRVVSARLFDGFGFGALDERRIVQAAGEAVEFLRCSPERLGESVARSEEHTSELQSLMRISYAVFCL